MGSNHVLMRLICAFLFGALAMSFTPAAFAQADIAFNVPTRGEVTPGAIQTFGFSGKSGQVISLLAESAGTLDPVLSLLNADNATILQNDDFAFPESGDALLQAITLPYTGRYTVQVAGWGDSAGQFTLMLSEGYAVVEAADGFASDGDWAALADETQAEVADGTLRMRVSGQRAVDAAFGLSISSADLAAFADVQAVSNSSGWITGIALRRNSDSYYALEINSEGRWRFVRFEDGAQTVVRDWTSHPAIITGETSFRIGAFAKGNAFDFFYDGAYVGSASDNALTGEGEVGVLVGTISSLESETQADFGRLAVTRPLLVDGQMPIPQQIVTGTGTTMAQALSRSHVVQGDGVMAMTAPEASVTYARPGVNRLMLGQNTPFADFAFGGTFSFSPLVRGPGGCGLVLRYASEAEYALAWLDGDGAFGLSVKQDENFAPGLFGQNAALVDKAAHHLLVVASGPTLYYYVDGMSAGELEIPLTEGQVGVAVVNFEGVDTSCNFRDLWLWRWD